MKHYEDLVQFFDQMVKIKQNIEKSKRKAKSILESDTPFFTGSPVALAYSEAIGLVKLYSKEYRLHEEKLKMMAEDPEWVTPFMKLKLQGLNWRDAIKS